MFQLQTTSSSGFIVEALTNAFFHAKIDATSFLPSWRKLKELPLRAVVNWGYFGVMFHNWSDYCLTCSPSLLYSFWGVEVSPLWIYCIFFLLICCHFLSPPCMFSSSSSCSHRFIAAILHEYPQTHYAFPFCAWGNGAWGGKKVACLRSNEVSVAT